MASGIDREANLAYHTVCLNGRPHLAVWPYRSPDCPGGEWNDRFDHHGVPVGRAWRPCPGTGGPGESSVCFLCTRYGVGKVAYHEIQAGCDPLTLLTVLDGEDE